jgi:hypothetical protein
VGRGEMPNELGDSWFSPKCIEVQPQVFTNGGRALDGLGGEYLTNSNQTTNSISLEPGSETAGDKLRSQKGNSPDHQLRSPRAG